MERIGDDNAGFTVSFDSVTNTVAVRAWGFWNVDVASSFGSSVKDACRNRPRGPSIVLDMSELKPMREEGQKSFAMLMGALGSLGIARTTVITSSQLTKLQLIRLASQAGASANVHFADPPKAGLRSA